MIYNFVLVINNYLILKLDIFLSLKRQNIVNKILQ